MFLSEAISFILFVLTALMLINLQSAEPVLERSSPIEFPLGLETRYHALPPKNRAVFGAPLPMFDPLGPLEGLPFKISLPVQFSEISAFLASDVNF